VGISVKNLDETIKFYTENFGIKKSDITEMTVPDAVRIATIKVPGANLEFVQYLSEKEILSRFGNPASDSIHHVAINVDNLADTLAAVKKQGGTLVYEKPMQLPGGRLIAFALPKNSHVLIEFMQD
jgi:methylmalonyl-CoA epimerase